MTLEKNIRKAEKIKHEDTAKFSADKMTLSNQIET